MTQAHKKKERGYGNLIMRFRNSYSPLDLKCALKIKIILKHLDYNNFCYEQQSLEAMLPWLSFSMIQQKFIINLRRNRAIILVISFKVNQRSSQLVIKLLLQVSQIYISISKCMTKILKSNRVIDLFSQIILKKFVSLFLIQQAGQFQDIPFDEAFLNYLDMSFKIYHATLQPIIQSTKQ